MKKTYKLPDFSGKCLSIKIRENPYALGLNDPHFEYQGDRLFIIGTIPQGAAGSNWELGAQRAIAWKLVTDYLVFDSLHTFENAIKKSIQYQKQHDESI